MTDATRPRLVTRRVSEIPPSPRRTEWGPWRLDADTYELYTEAGGYRYGIDLETCVSSAEVLDWICQIADKTWGDDDGTHDQIVSGLVDALIQLLHPQANLCSWGKSSRLSKGAIRRLIQRYRSAEED
jgi:hypothetical protein